MVSLEQVREWEEGLAKYTELWLWQHAQADSTYHPANAAGNSARFGGYKDFGQHWTQEMITLRLQSRGGETRFYYAGMAEAFLLDRLLPGWRTRGLHTGVSLEELLGEATEQRRT